MAYTVADLKVDLESMFHGTTINKITAPNSLIERASSDVLLEIDPQETIRIQQITNAIYNKVYDYVVPTDLKGSRIIDIRPQVNRTVADSFTNIYQKEFDQYKASQDGTFAVQWNQGIKTVRINQATQNGPTLNECDSITANGTWAVGGDATNLTTDTINYVSGSGSLNFDVTGVGTTAYLENATMTAIDLTNFDEQGSLFAWVYMPVVITDATLRWGNDSSNYWSRTVTSAQNGSFQIGWNLIRFDWNGATETGTVSPASIDYLRMTITYDGNADTDYRLDSIVCRQGSIYEIVYYSKYIFRDSTTGLFQERILSDDDEINLDTESRNLLLYKTAELAAQQIQGEDSGFDYSFFTKKYDTAKQMYIGQNKSQTQKPRSMYYRMPV